MRILKVCGLVFLLLLVAGAVLIWFVFFRTSPDYGFIDKTGKVVFTANNFARLDKGFSEGLLRVGGGTNGFDFWDLSGPEWT
ncbi:MAG TPA: hypothetical protein V6C81_08340 [Planktothrix sp.]|jgi:hypothetical protein